MFGYAKLNELNGDKIYRLENVLTLTEELHGFMDALELWFEGTVGPFLFSFSDIKQYIDRSYG